MKLKHISKNGEKTDFSDGLKFLFDKFERSSMCRGNFDFHRNLSTRFGRVVSKTQRQSRALHHLRYNTNVKNIGKKYKLMKTR